MHIQLCLNNYIKGEFGQTLLPYLDLIHMVTAVALVVTYFSLSVTFHSHHTLNMAFSSDLGSLLMKCFVINVDTL